MIPFARSNTDPGGLDDSHTRSSVRLSIWDNPTLPSEPLIDVTKSPILKLFPHTFVPLRHKATSIAEVQFLVPSQHSSRRQASLVAAVFNMTATIIGGGVLSIPLSCARAGIIPFTFLMIMSAIMTDFSLYILCSCTRRTGSTSFGRVAGMAVGPTLELFATGVIFFLVGFIVVGLMVLNQGIWTPIFMVLIDEVILGVPTQLSTTMLQDALVLLVLLTMMMKFLLAKDLASLRHICFVGFFSIAVLCIAMIYRAIEKNVLNPHNNDSSAVTQQQIKWAATDLADILSALPIILLAFLCSFNIISVHCSLQEPTRNRVRGVIHWSVMLSFLMMYTFGLAGYFWAYDDTMGNILLNFDPTDNVIFVGRIGCGITTLFALPMNLLPCREALLSLIAQISEVGFFMANKKQAATREERRSLLYQRAKDDNGNDEEKKVDDDKENQLNIARYKAFSERIVVARDKQNGNGYQLSVAASTTTDDTSATTISTTAEVSQPSHKEDMIHWISTLSIVLVCYIFAVLAPGVAIVWDIAGSSMAFLIQFIIPSVCYIRLKNKILGPKGAMTWNLAAAWVLLVVATIGAILCTSVVISRLITN